MEKLQGPESYNAHDPTQIPLRGKLRMRFYEPLILLLAATQACMHNLAPKVPESRPDRWNLTSEHLFHDFMNKLAQICDARPKGATVTAVVALCYPDRVQYRFASNQRSEEDLAQLKKFVTDILQTLRDLPEASVPVIKVRILRKVVAFTRARLECYVKAVAIYSDVCLRRTGDLASKVVQKLSELHDISLKANNPRLDEDTFFRNCYRLMEFIQTLSGSSTYKTFRDKANSYLVGQTNPWAEMRHAAGRLLSYMDGVQTLVEAREQPQWARLFHDFEIICIPSSQPHPNPIVISRQGVGAAEILGRMIASEDESKLADLQVGAQELQKFDLDKNIRNLTENKSFLPIIHAEILVHDSLRDLHPPRYFEGYRYIGTSKPACRLCDYYFRALFRITGDHVQVRQSHGNLYLNWRTSDLHHNQTGAVKQQEKILNDMILSVRQDTYRTLQDKIWKGKRHDSNTSATYNRGAVSVACSSLVEDDLDEVSSMLGETSLED